MCKGTEGSSGTAARLLHIIAFGGFVDLWMELLFCASVAVLAGVSIFTLAGISPLVPVLHTGTRRRSVFVFSWTSSSVFAIVVVGTGITLATEPGGFLTLLCLVISQHIRCILPPGLLTEYFLYHGMAGSNCRLTLDASFRCCLTIL